MTTFDVLTVGERQLQAFFDDFPQRLEDRLYAAMTRISTRLLAAVEAAEPNRSGQLRGATQAFVDRTATGVRAGVRVTGGSEGKAGYGKAAALESGAHRPTTVREHWAVRSNFWGRYGAAQWVLIDAYTRRVNISADRFLRGPFAALEGEIIGELEAALSGAAEEG